MTKREYKRFHRMALDGAIEDHKNPVFVFNNTSNELLLKLAKGEYNPKKLAQFQMAARGLDRDGKWVGFDKAAEIWGL